MLVIAAPCSGSFRDGDVIFARGKDRPGGRILAVKLIIVRPAETVLKHCQSRMLAKSPPHL